MDNLWIIYMDNLWTIHLITRVGQRGLGARASVSHRKSKLPTWSHRPPGQQFWGVPNGDRLIGRKILVGGFIPFQKYQSTGMMTFPIYGKIKNVPNHHPEYLSDLLQLNGLRPHTPPSERQPVLHGFLRGVSFPMEKKTHGMLDIWPWVKTYDAIFEWMNIHLPSILMFTRVPRL